MRGILGLDEPNAAAAEQVIIDIREEANKPQPDRGRLRTFIDKVQGIALSGTAVAAGTAIAALAGEAINNL